MINVPLGRTSWTKTFPGELFEVTMIKPPGKMADRAVEVGRPRAVEGPSGPVENRTPIAA